MEQAIKDLGLKPYTNILKRQQQKGKWLCQHLKGTYKVEHQDFDFENDEIYTEESEVCKQCFKTLSKEDLQLINITLKKYENNR